MSTLTERLREAVLPNRGRRVAEDASPEPRMNNAADTLGGDWCAAHGQPFLLVDRRYAGGHVHGRVSILDSLPPSSGVWPRLPLLAGRSRGFTSRDDGSGRLLFLDLETTGLAGGAGTYAFLVGLGWFEGAAFRVRQFFLSTFGAERAILEAVAELTARSAGLVTFNGKSFDVPLIDTRFALHRLPTRFADLPHVDMLHVARRFWRQSDETAGDVEDDDARGRGCRLSDLEQLVCGHEREGDVPGFEIPSRYFHFVRSGDARQLEAVLEHNRMDLISLALLTARASQMLEDGHAGASSAREALGLGFIYERAGLISEAREAYACAAGVVGLSGQGEPVRFDSATDAATRAQALRAYAALSRRERRFEEAALAWQRVLGIARCPPSIAREAAEALAVHHEHRQRDLDQARTFALQSLQYRSTPTRAQAVRHRLARLDRKMGRPAGARALF